MSYEGYQLVICEEGHVTGADAHCDWDRPCDCGSPIVDIGMVDETNGYPTRVSFEIVEIQPEQRETCSHCGSSKVIAKAKHKMIKDLDYWWDGGGYPSTKDAVPCPYD